MQISNCRCTKCLKAFIREREREGKHEVLKDFFWLMVIDGVVEIFKFSSKPEFTISYTSYVQNLC